jgi:uncharacterized protein with NRDE domain
MCLIAFAWGASERFPFVIAANRDEFFERPTAPLSEWKSPSGTTVIGGRDLRDGGTWMGFSPSGRFAMLTNVRQPLAQAPGQPISRGSLAPAWLESDLAAPKWAEQLQPQRYQGFNLIVGDWPSKQCFYLSNSLFHKPFDPLAGIESTSSAMHLIAHELPWGAVYGLSNAALDTPWPKTQYLKTALASALDCEDELQLKRLCIQALHTRTKPADQALPQTGVSIELERALSSPFVCYPEKLPTYGTRTSLLAIYQPGLGLRITETTHALGANAARTSHAQLAWP